MTYQVAMYHPQTLAGVQRTVQALSPAEAVHKLFDKFKPRPGHLIDVTKEGRRVGQWAVSTTRPAHQNPGSIRKGVRVQLHPATDWWMRGARYGEVVKITESTRSGTPPVLIHVRLDATGRVVKLRPEYIGEVVGMANPSGVATTKGEALFFVEDAATLLARARRGLGGDRRQLAEKLRRAKAWASMLFASKREIARAAKV